jgi:hypothetical protein
MWEALHGDRIGCVWPWSRKRDAEQRPNASPSPVTNAQPLIVRVEGLETLAASNKISPVQKWTGFASAFVAIVTLGFAGFQLYQSNQQLSSDVQQQAADIYARDVTGLSADLAGTRILAIRDLQQIAENRQPDKRREELNDENIAPTGFAEKFAAPGSVPKCSVNGSPR